MRLLVHQRYKDCNVLNLHVRTTKVFRDKYSENYYFKMEDIYTIRVKTRPDPGNLYPSERRYSASNVSGLAWIHLALVVMSFVLACLAVVNPIGGGDVLELQTIHDANEKSFVKDIGVKNTLNGSTLFNSSQLKLSISKSAEYSSILITAPSLLTIAGLISGIASILASKQWYIDRNIKWLFAISVCSTILSLISFCMIAVWIGVMSEGSFNFTNFYKNLPYDDTMTPSLDPKNIVIENSSIYYIVKVPLGHINSDNYTNDQVIGTSENSHFATKRVLSINILIAAFLELVWSCLSVRISWKGMLSNYPEDEDLERRGGNCLKVVTTLKGNNTQNLPRNIKIIPPKPNIIGYYPKNNKMKRLFLAHDFTTNGNPNIGSRKSNGLSQTPKENSAEYRERMYDFLNKCPSTFEDIESNPEGNISSVVSETSNANARAVSPIYEESAIICVENVNSLQDKTNSIGRFSCMSWGDSHDQTIYNQNTIDLDTIIAETRKGIPPTKIEKNAEESSKTSPNLNLQTCNVELKDTFKNEKNGKVDNLQLEKSIINDISTNNTHNVNVVTISDDQDVIIENTNVVS